MVKFDFNDDFKLKKKKLLPAKKMACAKKNSYRLQVKDGFPKGFFF